MAESSTPSTLPEPSAQKHQESAKATFSFTSDCTGFRDVAEPAEEIPVCWICLDPGSPDRPLALPCRCPRYCHNVCLARWQLQSAGTRKETHCEFCDGPLPDWRMMLTPDCGANAPAIMNVNFDGKTYSFEVRPGASGYLQFTEAIRHAFQLPTDSELNITFTCDEPCASKESQGGNLLTLQGPGAYDAAVYCASVSAARRQMQARHSNRAASSPNLMSPVDTNVHGSCEERSELQRSQTIGQNRQILRPEEFMSQATTPSMGSPSASSTHVELGERRQEIGERRTWSRIGSRIRALFSRIRK